MTPREHRENIRKNILSLYISKTNFTEVERQLDSNFEKGLIDENQLEKAYNEFDDIVKAKSGVYEDNWYNRKKGRVGQKYGSKKDSEGSQNKMKSELKELKDAEIKGHLDDAGYERIKEIESALDNSEPTNKP